MMAEQGIFGLIVLAIDLYGLGYLSVWLWRGRER